MKALGVIPARGGSKGVPGKNLRTLAGEPLLVHTIRAAQAARTLDRVVVSTDDDGIAAAAEAAGAEVVRRPAELATDESPTEDALIHALDATGAEPEYVVTLEPTSPLRTAETIDRCVELADTEGAGTVLTVVETREVLGRLEGSRYRHLEPGQPRRRQLREPLHVECSAVYVTRTANLRSGRSVLSEPLHAVVISPEEALDINTTTDFAIAEALLRERA